MRELNLEKSFTYELQPSPRMTPTIGEAALLFNYSLKKVNNWIQAPTDAEPDELVELAETLLIKVLSIRLKLDQAEVMIDELENGTQQIFGDKTKVIDALKGMITAGNYEIGNIDNWLIDVGVIEKPTNKLP